MSASGSERPTDTSRGVYGITTAAELAGTTPHNLRHYEARGLLSPARTDGGTRRYSDDDLDRLRDITELLDQGVNLAGIATILALQATNRALQDRLDRQLPTDPDPTPTDSTLADPGPA